jgi:hypothetical protein
MSWEYFAGTHPLHIILVVVTTDAFSHTQPQHHQPVHPKRDSLLVLVNGHERLEMHDMFYCSREGTPPTTCAAVGVLKKVCADMAVHVGYFSV